MSRRAFSLIEVMVVVAIILVIVAILFPVLAASKDRAKTEQCSQQLHQVAVAMHLYNVDADSDRVVPVWSDWKILVPYVKDARILLCPSDPYVHGANLGGEFFSGFKVSYYPVPYIEESLARELPIADPNHGILVCFVHGRPAKFLHREGPASPLAEFSGLVLRARKDGSVQRANPRDRCYRQDNGMIVKFRSLWDVFTDEDAPPGVLKEIGGEDTIPCP